MYLLETETLFSRISTRDITCQKSVFALTILTLTLMSSPEAPSHSPSTPWYRVLYIQVLIGLGLGILVGHFFPHFGASLKPLGDAFIRLIRMMIGPIIFCSVVHGIASMEDVRRLGRTGFKALLYFEVVSTIALVIGLVVVNVLRPGVGLHLDPSTLGGSQSAAYSSGSHGGSEGGFLLHIIPVTFLGAFTSGDILQVLLISILTAFGIVHVPGGREALHAVDAAGKIFFAVMGIVVQLAPIGAFGAMAFTVGNYGMTALHKLVALMAGFYLTSGLFILVVLGGVMCASGVSILRYLYYIREELALVLGTNASETALPAIMRKLTRLGCSPSTVGLVVPLGYSFNLDGTNIYMTMAAIFLAQATDTPLSLTQQLSLLLVAMLSSKGAAGVAGGGFVILAATLESVPAIPLASLALLVGIDRFMGECRSLTNFIGNGVATIAVSRWEGEVTPQQLREGMETKEKY